MVQQNETFLYQRWAEGLRCTPLDERPNLFFDVLDVLEAFWVLNAGRNFSEFGPLPLQLSEIQAYIELFAPSRDIRLMVQWIYAMDGAFLTHSQERQEARSRMKSKPQAPESKVIPQNV